MNTYPHLSCLGISKLISKDVIDIWKTVNPRLPLLKEIRVVNKLKILCFQKAKQIKETFTCCPKKILEGKVGYIFWYIIMFVQPANFKLWQY